MTKIIGLSGKKQSGKDSGANYILGEVLKSNERIYDFSIFDDGKLYVKYSRDGALKLVDYDSSIIKQKYAKEIKLYSFADELKRMCMNMFGLTWEQCYGTDEQKNSLTTLKWEDMPGIITRDTLDEEDGNMLCDWCFCNEDFEESKYPNLDRCLQNTQKSLRRINLQYHRASFMTAREVLQFFGTEILRKMDTNCHVNATLAKIREDAPEIAIIRDVRFKNELEGISNAGGESIRFLRRLSVKDEHSSETELDSEPESSFLAVIDNTNLSIEQKNKKIKEVLNL